MLFHLQSMFIVKLLDVCVWPLLYEIATVISTSIVVHMCMVSSIFDNYFLPLSCLLKIFVGVAVVIVHWLSLNVFTILSLNGWLPLTFSLNLLLPPSTIAATTLNKLYDSHQNCHRQAPPPT